MTDGTQPANAVHDVVVAAMAEHGIDLDGRTPREISADELQDVDYVVTMGCDADGVCPATWRGDARDWALEDPHGRSLEAVRPIRDEIERRVRGLFDELLGRHEQDENGTA